tara:strand:- start:393 stop:656 length:264 start_codon:yes stop_codon:yes gene_type:complete
MKKEITNPFQGIQEQIINITKGHAYDILAEQVQGLKADNQQLKEKNKVLTEALKSILNTKQEIGRSQPYIDTILEIAETAININPQN